jgi:Excalibur calcium-binding domain
VAVTPTSPGAAPAGRTNINCSAARADGRSNIPRGDPAYRPDLDHNGDGIACEG